MAAVPAFIPSPPSNGFHLGPLFVHLYGLMYVLAVGAAIVLTVRRWERHGGERALVYEVAVWAFPAGIIGARLYNLATSWNEVPDHWWGPLAIWKGGLGIWGGVAAGTLVGLWRLRRAGAATPAFMDAAAPGLLIAQAIGRIGNYFNQELFGAPTKLPWAVEISPAHRPPGYSQYATFNPTFLYELIFDLALAAALIALGRRRAIRAPGLFALYVAGYSGFRIFEELLRVDPSHHILGLRLNLYVAGALCVSGLVWFARTQRHHIEPMGRAVRRGGVPLGAGAILAMAGCGGATHAETRMSSSLARQETIVRETFSKQFNTQFDHGANAGYLREADQICRDEGVGRRGGESWDCEGWGLTGRGTCLLVDEIYTSPASRPTLEGKELQPGVGPFNPGSCKIGGEPAG
jgi:prolipoprotein diacylglyceryl transferase